MNIAHKICLDLQRKAFSRNFVIMSDLTKLRLHKINLEFARQFFVGHSGDHEFSCMKISMHVLTR